jgi:hypothetical protein
MSTAQNKYLKLLQQIELKSKELELLKSELAEIILPKKEIDKIIPEYSSVLQKVKSFFNGHFSTIHTNAEEGRFLIDDERYILIRSSSMSYDFFKTIYAMYSSETEENAFQPR